MAFHKKNIKEELRCTQCGKIFPDYRSLGDHERGKHKKKRYDKRKK